MIRFLVFLFIFANITLFALEPITIINPCNPNPCGNGVCSKVGSSYSCGCPSNYFFNNKTCVWDNCSTCGENTNCQTTYSGIIPNIIKLHSCVCEDGYVENDPFSKICVNDWTIEPTDIGGSYQYNEFYETYGNPYKIDTSIPKRGEWYKNASSPEIDYKQEEGWVFLHRDYDTSRRAPLKIWMYNKYTSTIRLFLYLGNSQSYSFGAVQLQQNDYNTIIRTKDDYTYAMDYLPSVSSGQTFITDSFSQGWVYADFQVDYNPNISPYLTSPINYLDFRIWGYTKTTGTLVGNITLTQKINSQKTTSFASEFPGKVKTAMKSGDSLKNSINSVMNNSTVNAVVDSLFSSGGLSWIGPIGYAGAFVKSFFGSTSASNPNFTLNGTINASLTFETRYDYDDYQLNTPFSPSSQQNVNPTYDFPLGVFILEETPIVIEQNTGEYNNIYFWKDIPKFKLNPYSELELVGIYKAMIFKTKHKSSLLNKAILIKTNSNTINEYQSKLLPFDYRTDDINSTNPISLIENNGNNISVTGIKIVVLLKNKLGIPFIIQQTYFPKVIKMTNNVCGITHNPTVSYYNTVTNETLFNYSDYAAYSNCLNNCLPSKKIICDTYDYEYIYLRNDFSKYITNIFINNKSPIIFSSEDSIYIRKNTPIKLRFDTNIPLYGINGNMELELYKDGLLVGTYNNFVSENIFNSSDLQLANNTLLNINSDAKKHYLDLGNLPVGQYDFKIITNYIDPTLKVGQLDGYFEVIE